MLGTMWMAGSISGVRKDDVVYCCMPLYHSSARKFVSYTNTGRVIKLTVWGSLDVDGSGHDLGCDGRPSSQVFCQSFLG